MTAWRHVLWIAVLWLACLAAAGRADAERGQPAATQAPPYTAPPVSASAGIRGLARARQHADGTLVVTDRLSGTGSVTAGDVIIEGELSPGYSPGCIDFGGNVTFSASATLQIEIGGIVPCSGHDRITVANQLTINGATLVLTLLGGFVPAWGDRFDILDWGSLTGGFGVIDATAAPLPAPLAWDFPQLYLTGELVVGVLRYSDGDLAPWNNPDGQVNAADVLIASQLVLGLRTPGALQYAHGDMDGDGAIDAGDLLLIEKTVLQ